MDEADEMAELYKEGLTQKEIAEKYDVTPTTVSRRMKEKGHAGEWTSKKITRKTVEEWIELYEDGLTQKEIAEKYGVAYSTVYNRLTDRGIEIS